MERPNIIFDLYGVEACGSAGGADNAEAGDKDWVLARSKHAESCRNQSQSHLTMFRSASNCSLQSESKNTVHRMHPWLELWRN